jgi:hypothetical protein
MKPSHRVGHRAGNLVCGTTTHLQMVESSEDKDGGRYGIRTYDFHPVNLWLSDFSTTQTAGTAQIRGSRCRTASFVGWVVGWDSPLPSR